jgi:hemolysin activation/secretion protein
VQKRTLFRVILLTLCFFIEAVYGEESASDNEEWRLRDKAIQEALEEKLHLTAPSIQLPEVESLPEVSEEAVCFVIKKIEITGLLSDWAKTQGHSYIGKCTGFTTIQAYVRLINQKLLSEGYITSRAVLPEQNIASGALIILIQEGVIEKITFPDDYRFFSYLALPLEVGNVLNLRDMEQAVDQLKRLQSQNVEFKIRPGTFSNGSVLVAEVAVKKPWLINMSLDDSGSDETGNYPFSLTATVDNVLGLQDSLKYALSWAREADTGESNSASLTWSLPIGYGLFEFTNSRSDYRQESEGSVTNFELSGTSYDNKLALTYVLSRNNKSKTSLLGKLKTRERRSYIDGTEIEVQQRNLTEIELGGNYRRYIGSSVLDLTFGIHQGLEWLDSDEIDPDASNDSAQPDYRFYALNGSISYPFSVFGKNIHYVGQVALQYADTAIYSLDWFSNGGRYTIRGFSSSEAVSEQSGWRIKNDLSLPVFASQVFSINSYFGLDIGAVHGDDKVESDTTLMGVSLGFKGNLSSVNYDFFVSKPFLEYGPYADRNSYQVNGMLSTQF